MQGLQVRRRFNNNERFLIVRNGRSVPVQALGVIEFVFESRVVMLDDCHYCPSFMLNVIFVGLLTKSDYEISIKKNYCNVILNDIIIFYGQIKHDIYTLSWSMNVMYMTNKHHKIDNVNDIYLWHCRLGHININKINRLAQ